MHEKGVAHLDVKPDNIYVKDGVYKLGDFGCVTLLDKSLPIEEGDARYMPQEILNERYDYLDKVDIFSLGAAIYEIARGSTLPETHFMNLKEGKLPLLPGHSLQFQNLIKVLITMSYFGFLFISTDYALGLILGLNSSSLDDEPCGRIWPLCTYPCLHFFPLILLSFKNVQSYHYQKVKTYATKSKPELSCIPTFQKIKKKLHLFFSLRS